MRSHRAGSGSACSVSPKSSGMEPLPECSIVSPMYAGIRAWPAVWITQYHPEASECNRKVLRHASRLCIPKTRLVDSARGLSPEKLLYSTGDGICRMTLNPDGYLR